MKLKLLGAGDAFCSAGRFQTCFYAETSKKKFLIDCGATSLLALKKHQIDIADIDVIFITHQHGDHFGGLPFIILDSMYESKRNKPLIIASAIPDFEQKVKNLLDLLYPGFGSRDFGFTLQFIHLLREKNIIEGLGVQVFPVVHSDAAYSHAIKIEADGKTVAYSGDTEWTDVLYEVGNDADLFICECNFFGLSVAGHMNYTALKEKAVKLNCKRLVLTHAGNEMLKNADKVSFPVAFDGMELVID